jgi:hypothetical protein
MSNQVTREQIDSLRVAMNYYIDEGLMDIAEADAFVRELAQADFSEGEMNTILQDLSNMAEGMGRQTIKDTKNFLYIAKGSWYELETQIIICHQLKYSQTRYPA